MASNSNKMYKAGKALVKEKEERQEVCQGILDKDAQDDLLWHL